MKVKDVKRFTNSILGRVLITAVLWCGASSLAERAEHLFVVTPSLVSIGGSSVAVPVPPGWRIGTLDMTAWLHLGRSGEFTLVPVVSQRKLTGSSSTTRKIELSVQVNNDDNMQLGTEKQVADDPRPFYTHDGTRCIVSKSEDAACQIAWTLAIPLKTKKGLVSVWLGGMPGSLADQRKLAFWIFHRVQVKNIVARK